MSDNSSGPVWSEAQWEKVNNAVSEAFNKASVAGAFLPCYGPLAESAEYIREEKFAETGAKVRVDDDTTLKLFNLTVKVELSREQVAEESLSSAMLAFRRAANTLAQVEDDIVFNGYKTERDEVKKVLNTLKDLSESDNAIVASHPSSSRGLVRREVARQTQDSTAKLNKLTAKAAAARGGAQAPPAPGDHIVNEIAEAVVSLESDSHPGPFACVLGAKAFVAVHTPALGLVLPVDRITPILNGPVVRSGRMVDNQGIVVSLAGADIDIVVATPPRVQFLQIKEDARCLFRVYEKFILRIKDGTAVRGIGI